MILEYDSKRRPDWVVWIFHLTFQLMWLFDLFWICRIKIACQIIFCLSTKICSLTTWLDGKMRRLTCYKLTWWMSSGHCWYISNAKITYEDWLQLLQNVGIFSKVLLVYVRLFYVNNMKPQLLLIILLNLIRFRVLKKVLFYIYQNRKDWKRISWVSKNVPTTLTVL